MTANEALKLLEKQIHVTPQKVTIAKGHIINHFNSDPAAMIKSLLTAIEASAAEKLVIHLVNDSEANIKVVADTVSWTLAGCEAVWNLISSGFLIPGSSDMYPQAPHVEWTSVVQGSGSRGSLDLGRFSLPLPRSVLLCPSAANQERQVLSDPDLFLHSLEIQGIHKQVEDSLREAVRCFRNELFLACLAMLGRASEGAWIELGLKLCAVAPPTAPINVLKIKEKLEDPFVGIGKKILETMQLYQRADVFDYLYKKSGIKSQDLNNAMVWADAVRESRNSVHYGVEPAMPNTYEKVAALIIGAVPHLRLLYKIMDAA